MRIKLIYMALFLCHGAIFSYAADAPTKQDRWQLDALKRTITWDVSADKRLPHADAVELSGQKTAAILKYAINTNRELSLTRTLIWPCLRVSPNNTHSSLKINFLASRPPQGLGSFSRSNTDYFEPQIQIDGKTVTPLVKQVHFETGLLIFNSDLGHGLSLQQTLTPCVEKPGYMEQWSVRADDLVKPVQIKINPVSYSALMPYNYLEKTPYRYGQPTNPPTHHEGYYRVTITSKETSAEVKAGAKGIICSTDVAYEADLSDAPKQTLDASTEIAQRAQYAKDRFSDLRFECSNPVLECLFDYSKIRACDSICQTKNGPLHAPGGEAYYAAIWANDTVEYVGPFFPFLGFQYANDATINALEQYSRFLNPQYDPLPSSIISEATDIWARRLRPDGLPDKEGDCGDAAMLAFGGSRFLLAYGNKTVAQKYWPVIEWSLEYCKRHTTAEGVIESASDELEERFESGKYKLNTSILTYGGLISGADLAEELGHTELAHTYRQRAEALHQAVRHYFEANVSGFETYQYHEGCKELRAWMCIPLTMGIADRKDGTIAALFSPKIWTPNGLLTTENDKTYWDRSTLHALRGVFYVGEPDQGLSHLEEYSRNRLLGEHVPYVIEAFPEGNGRHLSAESALYCRIMIEGLFGIRPTGFHKFEIKPNLPSTWNKTALKRIKAFETTFDVELQRFSADKVTIRITQENRKTQEFTVKNGEAQTVVILKQPAP